VRFITQSLMCGREALRHDASSVREEDEAEVLAAAVKREDIEEGAALLGCRSMNTSPCHRGRQDGRCAAGFGLTTNLACTEFSTTRSSSRKGCAASARWLTAFTLTSCGRDAIIAVLAALLCRRSPVEKKPPNARSASPTRQLSLATRMYVDDNHELFPADGPRSVAHAAPPGYQDSRHSQVPQ